MQLLRASAKHTGVSFDLSVVMTGKGDGGVPHGELLMAFGAAAIGEDERALDSIRGRVLEILGSAALVDAAAVAGLFNAIDRVADATGTQLEDWKARSTQDFRAEIGVDTFAAGKSALDANR